MAPRRPRRHRSTLTPEGQDEARTLMLRFQQGEDAAFEGLVELCKREVFALGYRYGLAAQDADDLAQEVFLRVYRARAAYRPDAPFRAWLLRIAQNLIISGARKRKLRRTLSLQALRIGSGEGDAVDVEDGRAEAPWTRLSEQERRAAIESALQTLPETQRVALVMNRFHDMSYEEVGAALDLKIPAVKSLLYRARQSLKQALEPHMGEEDLA